MTDTQQQSTALAPFDGDMDPAAKRYALAMWRHAQQLSKSALSGDLKNKPEDVFAVIAFADQFGVNPGNAIQMIWIIQGRIVPRSEFLAAITRAAGHEIRFEESSAELCTVAIRRRGDDYWQRVTWTIDDAKRAGLDSKDLWKKYTADMLCHATVRRAVKRIVPDVLLGRDLGGDEGVAAHEFRPPVPSDDAATPERVIDIDVSDWDGSDDDEPNTATSPTPDAPDIEDADVLADEPPTPADDGGDLETAAARDTAMRRLMATCGKAFPEASAQRGTKTHRQRLLRRAAQYAVLKEHRSASDLTADELASVEGWVHRHFLDDGATVRMTYDILDGDVVRFTFGDKTKDIAPAADQPAAA